MMMISYLFWLICSMVAFSYFLAVLIGSCFQVTRQIYLWKSSSFRARPPSWGQPPVHGSLKEFEKRACKLWKMAGSSKDYFLHVKSFFRTKISRFIPFTVLFMAMNYQLYFLWNSYWNTFKTAARCEIKSFKKWKAVLTYQVQCGLIMSQQWPFKRQLNILI